MPEDVRLAKHVRHLITAKNSISCGDEDVIEIADDDNNNDEEDVAGEFARPNTRDMDIALAEETLQVQATTSPAPSSSPRLSSTTSASSMDTNQETLNAAASVAVMQAGKRTPRRASSSTNGLDEIVQLQVAAMTEA